MNGQDPSKNKLWTSNFILIFFTNFVIFIAFYMLQPTLPMFIALVSGTDALSGLSMGVLLISAIAIRPFAGKAIDTWGRKITFLSGIFIFLTTSLVFVFVHSLFPLLFFRFIQGFGWGICNTASGTIAADIIPKHRLAEGIGYFALSYNIAMGIAPALALYILNISGYPPMFSFITFVLLLAIVLALLIKYTYTNTNKSILKQKTLLIEKAALSPSLVVMFVTLSYSSVNSFLAMYAIEKDIKHIGLFFAAYACSLIFSRPLIGPLADKKGYSYVIIPGMFSMGLTMVILWAAVSLPVVILAGALYGMAFGSVQPVLQAMSIANVPPERRGAATGTFMLFFDVGIGLGAILWGIVAHAVGYGMMYLLAGIPIIISLFAYLKICTGNKIKSAYKPQ